MVPHDLFAMYTAKATEYLIAVTFLLLFIPFWRFVNARGAEERVPAIVPSWLAHMVDWFLVPDNVHFHPGHAWARRMGEVVTVGIDDFAQKLLGSVSSITLPAIGAGVGQGQPAWSFAAGGKSVDMLSPIDGKVLEINERALASPDLLHRDPYGEGWLLKIEPTRPSANFKQLFSGALAKRWMAQVSDTMQAMMSPDLGRLYQDGGLPVHGIARNLGGENWDEVCRRFFLT